MCKTHKWTTFARDLQVHRRLSHPAAIERAPSRVCTPTLFDNLFEFLRGISVSGRGVLGSLNVAERESK